MADPPDTPATHTLSLKMVHKPVLSDDNVSKISKQFATKAKKELQPFIKNKNKKSSLAQNKNKKSSLAQNKNKKSSLAQNKIKKSSLAEASAETADSRRVKDSARARTRKSRRAALAEEDTSRGENEHQSRGEKRERREAKAQKARSTDGTKRGRGKAKAQRKDAAGPGPGGPAVVHEKAEEEVHQRQLARRKGGALSERHVLPEVESQKRKEDGDDNRFEREPHKYRNPSAAKGLPNLDEYDASAQPGDPVWDSPADSPGDGGSLLGDLYDSIFGSD